MSSKPSVMAALSRNTLHTRYGSSVHRMFFCLAVLLKCRFVLVSFRLITVLQAYILLPPNIVYMLCVREVGVPGV